jgi:two-component system, NtrC family, nitrogen regulation sensor histidine kinase NtrY
MTALSRPALALWFRKAELVLRRGRWVPRIELATFLVSLIVGLSTFLILSGGQPGQRLATPALAALLLVANLVPAIALIVLYGRRLAKKRAALSPVGGKGRLHVRLVALFSLISSIPVLLLVVFASLLFQYGVEFWYSDRARNMFENANSLAQTFYAEKQQRIVRETELMASDLSFNLSVAPIDSKAFNENFAYQVYVRELSEAAIVQITPKGASQSLALVNPYDRPTDNWVPAAVVSQLRAGKKTVFEDTGGRMQAITPLPGVRGAYVYAARVSNSQAKAQTKRFSLVLKNYNDLIEQSRTLQLRFHAALLFVTLLIVGLAVWVALNVADRLVKPVGELVDAAQRVTAGDLTARVASTRTRDEVGTLATAFNRMTGRLEAQRRELIEASDLIDRRRAFIEAVLSGVTAGIVAIGEDKHIRVINRSALALLGHEAAVGKTLAEIAPELEAMLLGKEHEAIVQLGNSPEPRTLAVKITQDEAGHVLTFDDITAQLTDQRRAAWADVARRIAHEIKNPLTPIQLAAERLKRRFGKEIQTDPATFARLTDTIVRQVGDLRRMVDEFSSFARMPKPVFRDEVLIDICRQAMFLHEVAHPAITFAIEAADTGLTMICDRRQLGQALTNIVKNAVEAIESEEKSGDKPKGRVDLSIVRRADGEISIAASDNGIGLPTDRGRLAEPYMTTRERGTGLGLAIVKKIVEEHGGALDFADRDGGGTVVTLTFPPGFEASDEASQPLDTNSKTLIGTRTA